MQWSYRYVLNYQISVVCHISMPIMWLKWMPLFKMATKIVWFTIKMQICEVNILYASMEFNGVIDMCLIIKFVLYAISLYPSCG